jgi:hypothetical protein
MEDQDIVRAARQHIPQLMPAVKNRHRPAYANGADGMNRNAYARQFIAQPAFETERELMFQMGTRIAPTGERREESLYAAVEIAAVNVKDAHQFHVPASLR